MISLFWRLLFAHFLADYPLQSTWLARNKTNPLVLALHVCIHAVVLLLAALPYTALIWPYLLGIVVFHYILDISKLALNRRRPQWVIWPYVVDQSLHYLSLWTAAWLIYQRFPQLVFPIDQHWIILALGYLLATHVWFISERILAHRQPGYQHEVNLQFWPRLGARAALLTFFLLLSFLVDRPAFALSLAPLTMLAVGKFPLPYFTCRYARRAMLTDLLVALLVTLFVRLGMG